MSNEKESSFDHIGFFYFLSNIAAHLSALARTRKTFACPHPFLKENYELVHFVESPTRETKAVLSLA